LAELPTGTVTFLFTDIEGSTAMWERDAKRMQRALARHDEILKGVVESHGGSSSRWSVTPSSLPSPQPQMP
jgi:class 3 adenylate cyclase